MKNKLYNNPGLREQIEDRQFYAYTDARGYDQFQKAILDSTFGDGWARLYSTNNELRVYSKKEIQKNIDKYKLDSDKIWEMVRSEDDEIKVLVSELLKMNEDGKTLQW